MEEAKVFVQHVDEIHIMQLEKELILIDQSKVEDMLVPWKD